MNLNEELSAADRKFLEKFGLLEDKDVEEAAPPPKPEDDDPGDEDPGTPDAPGEADAEAGEDDAEADGQDDDAPGDDGEGETGDEGEHKHDQESEVEGIDMDTEGKRETEPAPVDEQPEGEPIEAVPVEVEPIETEAAPQPDAQGDESGEEAGEGEDQGEGEQGPQEAQDDAHSDAEAEQESESEDQPAEEEATPEPEADPETSEPQEAEQGEADEDGEPDDDNQPEDSEGEDGEEEMQEAPEQQEQEPQGVPENPEPIALDIEGQPIFVGSTIASKADGNFVDEDSEPYMAEVLGRWVGTEEFANANPARMILIVERHDDEDDSDSEMKTAEGRGGWAVQSNLCAVVVAEPEEQPEEPEPEEEDEPEAEQPPAPQPPPSKEPYFLDAEGVQLFDGDQVVVVTQTNWCDWPLEAIAQCVMATRNGVQNPALMPQNFEDQSLGPWKSLDGQNCFAVSWGNTLEGIRKLVHVDERPEPKPKPPVPEQPQDEPEPEKPEPEVEPESEPEIPESEPEVEPETPERKQMTKGQRQRFENLAGRIFKKAEGTFGNSMQSNEVGPLLPGGVFDGEEVAKVLEVVSNGVTYRLTLSAERVE